RVYAIDLSPEAMKYAREQSAGRVAYSVGRAELLPFPSGTFDLVVAFEVLEHVADGRLLVAEARRVLAPGGVFAVSTPNPRYYTQERGEHNEFHVHEYEVPELQSLVAP